MKDCKDYHKVIQRQEEDCCCCCCCCVTSVCPTLCDPMDCSPPGSPIPGILQARTLEWAAISFSSAWKWKVKVKALSHVWLFGTPWTVARQAPLSMGFSRQEYWSGVPLPSPKKRANAIKKLVLIDLFYTGLLQSSICLKNKKTQYLQCPIKWSALKPGIPVYWEVIAMLVLKAERCGFESHLTIKLFYISSSLSYEMSIT